MHAQKFYRIFIPLLAALALVVLGLQLAVLYIPFISDFFNVLPLSMPDLLVAVGLGGLIFIAMELDKVLKKKV